MAQAKRLWEKGGQLNALVHQFTVGNDPDIDKELLRWDCIGSAAHARMLNKIGILSDDESAALLRKLKKILHASDQQDFQIASHLEDVHTAIEAALVKDLGAVGEKIHTGRSRNDQVILAMRLFLRGQVIDLLQGVSGSIHALKVRHESSGHVPMPGYTHQQPAMPSSVGLWLHAFIEAGVELLRDGLYLLQSLDLNPLGAAAGFGVPLPLDREFTGELLGFSRVQQNPINVQNSRGRYESKVLRWGVDVSSFFEKFACDLIMYSMHEFRFFGLPVEFTTGSSIMPQKQNPDVLELLRARAGRMRAAADEISWITAKLPSNYHRDFQYTKEPVFRGLKDLREIISVGTVVIENFIVNEDRLRGAMYPELYATYDTYRRVREGLPFREAYRETARVIASGELDALGLREDFELIEKPANAACVDAAAELAGLDSLIDKWRERTQAAARDVFTS